MQHIRLFLSAVAREWVALMSGLASLAIAIWLQFTKNPWISTAVFLAIAVACIVVACYRAWAKEHAELLKYLEASEPKFVLTLYQSVNRFRASDNVTQMLINVQILNRGADSVAIKWRAHYKSDTLDKDMNVKVFLEDSISNTIKQPNNKDIIFTVKRDDLIFNKTKNIVARGAMVTGPFFVSIPGNRLQEISDGSATITVSTEDYLGNVYSGYHRSGGPSGSTEFQYYPGADIRKKKPLEDLINPTTPQSPPPTTRDPQSTPPSQE